MDRPASVTVASMVDLNSVPGSEVLDMSQCDQSAPNPIAAPSRVIAPTGEQMLSKAIALTLAAPPAERADLFEQLTREIGALAETPAGGMRPWTCSVHTGTDGSRVFCGGIGLSIVVDPQGRLWRARTYEDFDTTYTITPTSCEVATMTPKYADMREYQPR